MNARYKYYSSLFLSFLNEKKYNFEIESPEHSISLIDIYSKNLEKEIGVRESFELTIGYKKVDGRKNNGRPKGSKNKRG